eukprot:5648626-Pyramimonas_sp.AAC.1
MSLLAHVLGPRGSGAQRRLPAAKNPQARTGRRPSGASTRGTSQDRTPAVPEEPGLGPASSRQQLAVWSGSGC